MSLKEHGRREILSSKLLNKVFDTFVDDNYAEKFYAYTLNTVIEALQTYYNNIKEVVQVINEKLNDLLIVLRKKCVTYTEAVEKHVNFNQPIDNITESTTNSSSLPPINLAYKNQICY